MAHRPGCSSSTWSSSPSASIGGAAGSARFTADRGDHARRLDHAVLRHTGAHRLSRALVQRLVSNGQVLVNGRPASRSAQRVRSGDVVHIESAPARARTAPAAELLPLDVLYEDDHLLAVNKPAGQVAHPSFKNATGTLLNALLGHAAAADPPWQPHLVQRLDKGTSGLLLVAKSRAIQTALQRASIIKDYLALVWGRPVPATGRIETRLGRDPLDRRRVVASVAGTVAITEYRTLARTRGPANGLTLLACRLVTGRTHQLRVHLLDGGWPLVGDPVYRARGRERLPDPRLHRCATTFGRQALHAWRLVFTHPASGAPVDLTAAVPADLGALLEQMSLETP